MAAATPLWHLTHGLAGLALAWALVWAGLLCGLRHGRGTVAGVLLSPLLSAPLMLIGALLSASASAWLWPALPASGLLLTGVAAQLGVGYAAGRALARPRRWADRHRRGTVLMSAPRRWRQPRRGTVQLAGITVPATDEAKHFKLLGTTGTGKSTAIGALLEGALARGDRAVIADPDGTYLARFFEAGRGDVLLSPFEPGSRRWELFGEIELPYDVEQLARALIPDGDSAAAREWRAYARTFLCALLRALLKTGNLNLTELCRLLTCAPLEELRVVVARSPAQPFLEPDNARMFGSIRSVTGAALAALEFIAEQHGPACSVRRWVRQGSGVLFMPYRAAQIAALRSLIAAWMRLAIFEAMNAGSVPDPSALWFIVDELDALGPIDGLKDALARLRKFGGRCVLGFQSIAQVSHTYGPSEAQTIVENCGNTLILRCSASEHGGTARFASRLIGQREVLRLQTSANLSGLLSVRRQRWGSISEQQVTEDAVMASEIEQLPDLAGYLKLASAARWQRVRLPPPHRPARA